MISKQNRRHFNTIQLKRKTIKGIGAFTLSGVMTFCFAVNTLADPLESMISAGAAKEIVIEVGTKTAEKSVASAKSVSDNTVSDNTTAVSEESTAVPSTTTESTTTGSTATGSTTAGATTTQSTAAESTTVEPVEIKAPEIVVGNEAVEEKYGFVNLGIAHVDNHLNVRKEPKEDGEIVGKMPKNAGCEIISTENGWAKIKSGKVEGYVSMEFLYTGAEARGIAEEVKTTMATVNTMTLKVRTAPSTNGNVITLIPEGEELEVLEDTGEWVKIAIDDEEGFISKEFVDIAVELDKAVTLTELKFGEGVSDVRISLISFAKKYVGNPYVWGGTSLDNGADCSGFVMSVFKNFGVSLPHSSRAQAGYGTGISLSDAKPGDLVFYGNGSTINHVAIYIGGGQVVHASSARTGIKISNATYRTPLAVRRIL